MILELIKDLFTNLAIFTSTTVLLHYFFKDKVFFTDVHDIHPNKIPFRLKMMIGFCDGMVGTIIMFYGLDIGSGIHIDLRHLSIMISALFGGLPSALLAGGIIALSRMIFITNMDFPSIVAAINAINMAIGCGLISTYVSKNKWRLMTLYSLVSITIVAMILFKDINDFVLFLTPLWTISIISAFCIIFLLNHLIKSNALQTKIKENEEKFRLITENMSDVVILIDPAGRALYVSPSLKLYGIDPKDYIGSYPLKNIHPEDIKRVQDEFRKMLKKKNVIQIEFRWRHPKGHWVDIDTRGTPIEEDGVITKVVLVSRDITERKKMEQKLQYLSNIDPLTGIANRRYLDRALDKEWKRSMSESTPLSFLMFDIDHFKEYNDTYGHRAGDRCLQRIADLLQQIVKPPHIVARYGGEEFAVILPQTDNDQAKIIAEEIRFRVEALRLPHIGSPDCQVVTVSIGVATQIATPQSKPDQLIEKADRALYQVKNEGRNRVLSY